MWQCSCRGCPGKDSIFGFNFAKRVRKKYDGATVTPSIFKIQIEYQN